MSGGVGEFGDERMGAREFGDGRIFAFPQGSLTPRLGRDIVLAGGQLDHWRGCVEIRFRTRRLDRVFAADREIERVYGAAMASVIRRRITLLLTANSLTEVPTLPPTRRHSLSGRRRGQYAIDLAHPYRLIFEPDHHPVPLRADGGVDTDRVTAITIIEVVDYH